MNEFIKDDWKKLFELNKVSFFETLQESVQKQEADAAYEAVNYLTDTVIYLLEMKRTSDLEELLPHIEKLVFQFFFLADVQAGMYVLKGRIETLLKMMKLHIEVTPDPAWFIQLRSKYDHPILLFLYQKTIEQVTRISEYLSIKGPQLTPILSRLEELEFILREKEGKNVWCKLTKKGYLVAKYLYQTNNAEPIIQLIQEIRFASEHPEKPAKVEHIIKDYQVKYPQYLGVIQSLRDLLNVTIFSRKTVPSVNWKSVKSVVNPEEFVSVLNKNKGLEFSSQKFIEFEV